MECPECGCPYFYGIGSSTSDIHRAWEDKDGKWYSGPSNETMHYSCQNCSYSYDIVKKRGKIIKDSRITNKGGNLDETNND